jgi:hypothetical protein
LHLVNAHGAFKPRASCKKMKTLLLGASLCLSLFFSSARAQSLTIYCTIDKQGRVNYNKLDQLLPDSLKQSILIDYAKEYDLHAFIDALLLMSFDGWKLISIEGSGMTRNTRFYVGNYYVLSRDILLDEPAMKYYADHLKALEIKR